MKFIFHKFHNSLAHISNARDYFKYCTVQHRPVQKIIDSPTYSLLSSTDPESILFL